MSYEWKNMERKFGHCIVNWKIQNYYLLPMDNTWQILSPEFEVRGFKTTKWIMILTNKKFGGELNLCFYLQNLNFNEPKMHFLGTCNLEIFNKLCRFVYVNNFSFTEVCTSYERRVKIMRDNISNSDDLFITCKIFIRFSNVDEDVGLCTNIGQNGLSQDLLTLFESKRNYDVILKVHGMPGTYNIEAHRPILCSRNTNLKKIFDSNKITTEIVVDHFGQYDEWNNVLRFLYTADMKHVLRPPKQAYYNIALAYDIKPVISFYEPDEYVLHSAVLSEEFSITWTINEFFKREAKLHTPQIKKEEMGIHWQIKMYPKSYEKETITCFCAEVNGKINGTVVFEVYAMNDYKNVLLSNKCGNITDNKTFKGYCFVERQILKRYLKNDNLTLRTKLIILDSKNLTKCKRYIDKSIIKCMPYSEEDNYSALSRDLLNLHYNSDLSDKVNFLFGNEECFIHRCVLSARALTLYKAIKNKIINYRPVRPFILNELIYFLYSGKLNSQNYLEDTFDLYDIAHTFKIKSLTRFLLNFLLSNMRTFSYEQIQRVFEFGVSKNIQILKISAYQLLVHFQ